MAKIVYNECYGGFSLSDAAFARYQELSGDTKTYNRDIPRNSPALIQVIEEMGEKAYGHFALLRLHELPDGTKYRIQEYDGMEWVETPDDIEWSVA